MENKKIKINSYPALLLPYQMVIFDTQIIYTKVQKKKKTYPPLTYELEVTTLDFQMGPYNYVCIFL